MDMSPLVEMDFRLSRVQVEGLGESVPQADGRRRSQMALVRAALVSARSLDLSACVFLLCTFHAKSIYWGLEQSESWTDFF
jgi:hypothetical protein